MPAINLGLGNFDHRRKALLQDLLLPFALSNAFAETKRILARTGQKMSSNLCSLDIFRPKIPSQNSESKTARRRAVSAHGRRST
jgi:hypothetical protein